MDLSKTYISRKVDEMIQSFIKSEIRQAHERARLRWIPANDGSGGVPPVYMR